MTNLNPKDINTTALAYIGDAVYEIYARKHVLEAGIPNVDMLHKYAVHFVCADGQAKALKALMTDFLTEEEVSLAKRARNHKTSSKARSADPVTYKLATAFEALIGWLHLDGQNERMEEIIYKAFEIIEGGRSHE
ncbi:MAG: ribonuclease III [Firmicutes bacterium]|nr:ribonuclease III [Bacillota bacterium]